MLLLGTLLALHRLKRLVAGRLGILISLGTGAAIFLGFTLSGYPADGFPRFFAPALILITYPVMALLLEAPTKRKYVWAGLGAVGLLFGLTSNAAYLVDRHRQDLSISSGGDENFVEEMKSYQRAAEALAGTNLIALEGGSFWLYYPDVSFISSDLGKQGLYVAVSAHPEIHGRLHPRCWETMLPIQLPAEWVSADSSAQRMRKDNEISRPGKLSRDWPI